MEQENKKKKIIVAIIGVLVLLVVLGGATLAFFSATDTEDAKQITTAKEELDVKINGSTHISNIKPINNFLVSGLCEDFGELLVDTCPTHIEGPNKKNIDVVSIPITVTNNSTIDINYNLYVNLENLELNNSLTGGTTEDIKWAIYRLPSEDGYSDGAETFGDFYDTKKEQKMLYEIPIKPEEIHYYVLFIYIEDTIEEQNKLQNISFDVKIKSDTKPLNIVGRKLTDVILENNIVKNRKPNYKLVPTNDEISGNVTNLDKGLFKVQNTDKDIYYFRGALPDGRKGSNFRHYYRMNSGSGNIVGFGTKDVQTGMPILWRIVRINEDGSVVLVTNEHTGIKYNWKADSGKPDYVGSNIQQELENWFDNTFSEKEKDMIKETTYCNDRSDNYTAVSKRLNKENPEPTLECKDEKDRITSKIGLLTADELVMAGGYTQDYLNGKNLSFENNIYGCNFFSNCNGYYSLYITISPVSENSYYVLDDDDLLYDDQVNSEDIGYIYPVITLNPDVKISKGVTVRDKFYPSSLGQYENGYYIGYDQ